MLLSNLLSTKSIAGTFASAGEIICQCCFGFLFNKLCCPLSYFALFHQTIRNQMFYFFFFCLLIYGFGLKGFYKRLHSLKLYMEPWVHSIFIFFSNDGNVILVVLILISKLNPVRILRNSSKWSLASFYAMVWKDSFLPSNCLWNCSGYWQYHLILRFKSSCI